MIALWCFMVLNAQNKKGNWILGASVGSAGFTKSNSTSQRIGTVGNSESENKYINIALTPYAGYYFTDKIVAGAVINLSFSNNRSESHSVNSPNVGSGKTSSLLFGVGPFGRFYFGELSNKGMPFTEVSMQLSFIPAYKGESFKDGNLYYTVNYDSYLFKSAGAKIGYEHFLTRDLGLQYTLGVSYSRYNYTFKYDYVTGTDSEYEETYKSFGLAAGLGLVIHFEGKQQQQQKKK